MFGYRTHRPLVLPERAIFDLAHRIERLAPAGNPGPNPEYLWPPTMPTFVPIEHDFAEWHDWNETTAGRRLLTFVMTLLNNYDIFFP